jgi:hypothetical protein
MNSSTINDPLDLLWFADERKSANQQIWIVGCSYAYGKGVDKQERYGQIVADNFNLPVSFLASTGTSISWAANQILRSDIKEHDLIVWGLTGIHRYDSYKNYIEYPMNSVDQFTSVNNEVTDKRKKFEDQLTEEDKDELVKRLFSEEQILMAVRSIFQVINFCKKVNAKLVIFLHTLSYSEAEQLLLKYLNQLDNVVHLSTQIDFGTDLKHPGPQTHKNWASEIIEFIKRKKLL